MPFITSGTMSPTVDGSGNDCWSTPQALYDALDREFGFTVDVASDDSNAKHARHWTLADDGLAQDWTHEVAFMNPPYGRSIGKWCRKALESARGGGERWSP